MELITFFKARKYQLFPTAEQEATLRMWSTALIPLWNDACRALKHNRRLWRQGWHKPASVRRGYIHRVWMELKKDNPGSDFTLLPSDVVGEMSRNFDRALDNMYKKKGGAPNFKDIDKGGYPSLEFPVWKKPTTDTVSCAVVLGRHTIRFPNPGGLKSRGLGRVKYDHRQKIKGKPKTATITFEGNKWWVSVACEITAKPYIAPTNKVGIDIGVAQHVATSDNQVFGFIPKAKRDDLFQRVKVAQRKLSRAQKKSRRRNRARIALAKAQKKIADCRKTAQHEVARRLVDANGFIAVENLTVKNMTASAAGTAKKPGKNVRAKSGLNREILNVSPYAFRLLLTQKMARTTGTVVAVDPKHTSQTCSACGVVDAASRKSQSEFVCVSCGHTQNADFNAARNILHRGLNGASAPPRKAPSIGRESAGNAKSPSLVHIRAGGTPKNRGKTSPRTNDNSARKEAG